MCNIYASADPARYDSTTRSVRLRGYVTSVRLENEFWDILETLATQEQRTVSGFISRLYEEAIERQGEVGNFTSMLRVVCATYLRRAAAESGCRLAAATNAETRSTGT